ncbi:Mucin-19 [Kitasatospora kazusensis]|uniref:Mucin-19 n=1 Tax=Kitasatospora kazusensis TaxID=407974 RepID=A0ABN3A9N2_9ACTN
MDRKTYTAELASLRELRTEITAAEKVVATAQKELDRLTGQRSRRVAGLAGYEGAQAAPIAKASGLTLADIVRIAPLLDPTPAAVREARPAASAVPVPVAEPAAQPVAVVAPAVTQQPAPAEFAPVPADQAVPVEQPVEQPAAPAAPIAAPATVAVVQPAAVVEGGPRVLPEIPQGPAGDRFAAVTSGLVSTRPNFTQQTRVTVFLDVAAGELVAREHTLRLNLGAKSPGEILDAVLAAAPGTERIYVTAGAPWHEGAERYSTLKDAVAAWLNTPSQRWTTATGAGKDKLAGHFVHQRQPVGRYAPAADPKSVVEVRSIGEWFDTGGADPATCRDAFRLLWQALRRYFDDAVLMGSPSQTGRDLWTRTIPTKGKWAGGYPVMSQELRGLLHATGGQGRTELLPPPRVPQQLPGLVEFDATFAYGKQTWKSGVGAPRRVTARAFAAMDQAAQAKALMACSHWHIRVTVPQGWDHVGLLPAPVPGDRAWEYPATGGATFTTWAGGAEVHLALTNHLMPWKVEVLDGLIWEDGKPIDDWGKKLKAAWADLTNLSKLHGDERQRTAAYLASRAVRSILLFGIGGFAQRPRTVTGTTPIGEALPAGVEILGQDENVVTWQRSTGFSRDPNAHPEWAARVWSGARTALLSMKMREDDVMVGALHLPAHSIVAFRTDAIYTTADVTWPYHGQPGEFLKKGHLPGPVAAPTTLEELLALRDLGRAHYAQGGNR